MMPPLNTPATAVLFMIGFFVVVMGIPFFFAEHKFAGHKHHHVPK